MRIRFRRMAEGKAYMNLVLMRQKDGNNHAWNSGFKRFRFREESLA